MNYNFKVNYNLKQKWKKKIKANKDNENKKNEQKESLNSPAIIKPNCSLKVKTKNTKIKVSKEEK